MSASADDTGTVTGRQLIEELRTDATPFRFFQAVRLLALSARVPSQATGLPPGLRFRSSLGLSFPAGEIAGTTPRGDSADPQQSGESDKADGAVATAMEMEVAFIGMTGPSGVLPVPYTEMLTARAQHQRDTAAHAFLDIFTHRAASLLYGAWRKHRFPIIAEHGGSNGLEQHLLALGGLGLLHLRERLRTINAQVPDRFFAYFAGLVAQRPHSATAIAAVLEGYFGCAVAVQQYAGAWLLLPPQEQTCLGMRGCDLGSTALAGERVWDRQHRIGLTVGPLDRARFDDMLPGRPGAAALHLLIAFFLGSTLACNVTLLLSPDAARGAVLDPTSSARLGYDSWLGKPQSQDVIDDVRFAVMA